MILVDTILKVTGKSPEVQWDNSKPTTIPFRACSTERIKTELGFKPDYTFEKGMKETIEWYENNYKDELIKSMNYLAEKPDTIFVGQQTAYRR